MNINRHNYEEFFILYADNELSPNEREQVELFIQQNPDLTDELEILQQSKFTPDTDIVFEGKESLMKAVVNPAITLNNPEEWLLLYTDNELQDEQKVIVEKYIASNPAAKKELELFQKTKLQAEHIVFPNKESLYRKEEKVRVISIRWWRIAAAAVLFIAISTVAFIMFNKETGNNNSLAGTGKINTKQSSSNSVNENNSSGPVKTNEPGNNKTITDPVETKSTNIELASTTKTNNNTYIKEDANRNNTIAMNDIQQTDNNEENNDFVPNMKANQQVSADFVSDIPTSKDLTATENKQPIAVTQTISHSLYTTNAPISDENIDAEKPENRGTVRGFLRRVTRTIEKTTNIKATDDDDRLLVGGLAVKL